MSGRKQQPRTVVNLVMATNANVLRDAKNQVSTAIVEAGEPAHGGAGRSYGVEARWRRFLERRAER